MGTDTLVAFSQKILGGSNFPGILISKVRVGDEICIAVPRKDIRKLCRIVGWKPSQIKMIKTHYDGVYLAAVSVVAKKVSKKDQLAVMRQSYMKLCGYGRREEQIKILASNVSKLSSEIEEHQKNLVDSLRKLQENQLGLQRLQNTSDDSLVRFGDEFDQLVKHPDIENLEIVGDKLVVYTKLINITYRKSVYNIGKFKITIYTDGSDGCVKMCNLTHKRDGYNHPHVDSSGQPCLGNIKEVIPHVIAEHNYAAAASICIQFLKSYEFSENHIPYSEIEYWPKVKKGGQDA